MKPSFNINLSLATLTACLLIAAWIIFIQHGWIAIDSILYFEMARYIAAGDWQAAYQVEGFSWGFYPALIAGVHVLTGLSLQNAANFLILLFFGLLVRGMMQLVKTAGGDQSVQILAVFLLLGSRYIVGDVLPMASRDLGYWSMMVLAVNQLILFYQQGKLSQALYWQLFAVIATLFRIEGAVFLLCLPLISFFIPTHPLNRLKTRCLPYIVLALLLLCGLVFFLQNQLQTEQLGRVRELWTGLTDIQNNFTGNLIHRVDVMRDAVIGEPFQEFAWITFMLAYFSIASIKCLAVAGWAPALLAGWERKTYAKHIKPVAHCVLLFWMFLSWVIGCLITFKVNLLSARYVALFGMVLVIFASFALRDMFRRWHARRLGVASRAIFVLAVILVIIGFVGSVKPKNQTYHYEIDAVHYVQSISTRSGSVLYTSPRQRFYAQMPYEGRDDNDWAYLLSRIEDGRIQQYDFLLIRLDDKPENAARLVYLQSHLKTFTLDKVFYGHKKIKRVMVYRRLD